MFASGETSDVGAEKSVAVEGCSMSVCQRVGCEVAGGRGREKKTRESVHDQFTNRSRGMSIFMLLITIFVIRS